MTTRLFTLLLLAACTTETPKDTSEPADTDTGTGDTADSGTDTADTDMDTADTADTGVDTADTADTGGDTAETGDTEDTAPPGPDLTDRLLIHLPFDGTLADASANAWPGDASVDVASFTTDHHGTADSALAYGGCTQLPDVPFDGTRGGFGFSVWLKPTVALDATVTSRSLIAGQGGGVLSLDYNYGNYYIEIYSDGARGVYSGTTTQSEAADTWVHLVISSAGDNTATRVWRNGTELSWTGTPAPSLQSATARWYVPCSVYFPSIPAAMDDVRVYERALDAADVAALYAL
ncbi:hypothetical protein LBMAG42_24170 [Deltaproteobacteria bacterium]|nr:hypothetical protein LBMAG42_24170 [Deltaproteobacteria bacterium]